LLQWGRSVTNSSPPTDQVGEVMVGIRCGRDSHSFVDWMHFRLRGYGRGCCGYSFRERGGVHGGVRAVRSSGVTSSPHAGVLLAAPFRRRDGFPAGEGTMTAIKAVDLIWARASLCAP